MGHTMYEASIGFSFKKSLFNPQDLSYVGKGIKYHFLSTQIPFYFSNLFDISYINSLLFIARLFLGLVFFLLISSFFTKFSFIKIPIFLFLHFPFCWGIALFPDSLAAKNGLGSISLKNPRRQINSLRINCIIYG